MKNKNSQKGYTLIEVAVSLFVISVVILLYTLASQSMMLNANSKHQQIANRIAASKVEDLKYLGVTSLPASGQFYHPLLSSLPSGNASLNVSDVDVHLKQTEVIVTWQEPGSAGPHRVILTTLIGEGGL